MTELAAAAPAAEVEVRVLEVVRLLAEELGGARAARAVAPGASLERDVGLGSLERVELLLRLETTFRRTLDDRILHADTPRELARVILEGGSAEAPAAIERASALVPAAASAPGAKAPLAAAAAAATVHDSLWRRAQSEPGRAHVLLRHDDGTEETVTYGALLAEAAAVAGALRDRGLRRGDTVALMLPTGREFLAAFQGILIAGAVPVPIYPPARLDRLEEYARRQAAILADAEVRTLVTIGRARGVASVLGASVPSLQGVVTVEELTALGASWPLPQGSGADTALIQYTSGSTGAPKGVVLTHDNLLANVRAIGRGLGARATDVGASWLPLYHDMGLIGTWLFCLHHGIPLSLQSPLAFLTRPERWLQAIHRHRATLSPAPNFAFELCVRRIPEHALEGLDLSCWRVAFNGAEPVSPETIDRFVERFGPYGFRREAMMPVYGLAESSVALCFPPLGRGPRLDAVARAAFEKDGRAEAAAPEDATALRLVSVGQALPEHEVQVVDPSGRALPERTVGRVAFRGPSTMAGYHRRPEATAAITLPGGWLDTGDLGYVAEGELFIAGRSKDVIIKAGRNLVPQEIEEIAAAVPGVRRGCVVAFGVSRPELGTETLVVVAETRATEPAARAAVAAGVRDRVAAALGVPPDTVALVAPGAVPKTSSGKVRRTETRELYLSGALGDTAGTPLAMKARVAAGAVGEGARRALRAVSGAAYAAYVAALIAAAVVFVWTPIAAVPSRRLARLLTRRGARVLLVLAGCRLSRQGPALPREGPLLLTSNHTSYVDVLALLALVPRDFVFAAKSEIGSWPVIGTVVRRVGHLTVDRFDVSRSVADAGKIALALEEGACVLLFPEGTFTAGAGLRPFRLGAFKAAVDTGVPVVPLALRGTRAVLRPEQAWPRPGPIHLWMGTPLAPEGDGWRAVVALRDRVADAIASHCGEPRLDLVAGGPSRG
ncbi:MAG TPA: AMP-binding protein [Vicinamibacteria bacterium]|nr:AMP-binding protein [Vicinamibacteria bacterium]